MDTFLIICLWFLIGSLWLTPRMRDPKSHFSRDNFTVALAAIGTILHFVAQAVGR